MDLPCCGQNGAGEEDFVYRWIPVEYRGPRGLDEHGEPQIRPPGLERGERWSEQDYIAE